MAAWQLHDVTLPAHLAQPGDHLVQHNVLPPLPNPMDGLINRSSWMYTPDGGPNRKGFQCKAGIQPIQGCVLPHHLSLVDPWDP